MTLDEMTLEILKRAGIFVSDSISVAGEYYYDRATELFKSALLKVGTARDESGNLLLDRSAIQGMIVNEEITLPANTSPNVLDYNYALLTTKGVNAILGMVASSMKTRMYEISTERMNEITANPQCRPQLNSEIFYSYNYNKTIRFFYEFANDVKVNFIYLNEYTGVKYEDDFAEFVLEMAMDVAVKNILAEWSKEQ